MNAQETGNAIGAKMREVHSLAIGTPAEIAAGELHDMLAQAAVDFHPELDWDQLAGNSASTIKGAHTDGGGKTAPPASN